MKNIYTHKALVFTLLFISLKLFSFAQSNHTVTFSGSTTDFNAAEKYTSVDNVDYYVTYDATYVYFGAFRNAGNSWGTFDHFTIYIDNFGAGAGSNTGVNWDGNTPTLPFASDYRIAIRNNASGESFFSSYSGSWTTGGANAQAWTQYTTASADGALEVRVPWSDLGNPNAIRFFTYASYNTGYFGYAPNGTSATGPSGASQWFGCIGTKSADCVPTNTTNLILTGTGTLTNGVPAAAGTYARVIVNAGTVTNANAWTLAPGGILEVTGGTFAIGAQTITFGNTTTSNGKGTTINTSGAGVITSLATTVLAFGGEGNITGNNLNTNGTIRILNKFTPLAAGGLTFNSGAALDIRNGGYINTNAPSYANGSNLYYNTGGTYTAGAEWSANSGSGVGVPNNISIGNTIAASQLDFGSSSQFRQLTGNLTLSATATLALSTSIGGDLQIGGSITNTAGATLTHNSRAVTFNGTVAQNLNSTALTMAYVIIANTTAAVTTVANTTIINNLTIDANARLNIGATTLTITGATSNINGFLRSAGTITGASTSTLTFNSGGTYEHNYTTTLGVIPTATWNSGSNCNIIGYSTVALTATGANGFGQPFSNFTWNCTAQTAAFSLGSQLTSIGNNLTILTTNTGNLTLSNTAATIINVGGNLIQSGGTCTVSTTTANLNVTGDFNQSGGTFIISSTPAIIAFLNVTGNVNKTGGSLTVSNSTGNAQLVVGGNFTQSLGTTTVSSSTGAPQLNVTGTYTQSGGTTNVSIAASGAAQMNITSDFTISGGIFNVSTLAAPAVLTVTGNVSNSGGIINIAGTGASQLNANANFTQSAGTTNISNSTGVAFLNVRGDFTLSGGTFTKTVSAAIVGLVTFNGTSNQNINITVPSNITGSVSFRLNNSSGITIVNGSTIPVNSVASFRKTLGAVTLAGSGAIVYNAANSYLVYDGSTDITTSDAEWPVTNGPVHVTLGHTVQSNINLHAARILPLSGILTINALNRFVLGANDFTVNNTALVAITTPAPSATSMVVADGAGRLIRSVTTGITYVWPIGETTGTIEYSPVSVNFSATSTARDIGFNVVNVIHPQMNIPDPQAHYRLRYFGVYNSTGGTYTYTATFNYLNPADNIGTATNIKLNAYTGVSWLQVPQTTSTITTSVTTSAVNETTFPLNTGYEIVGRSTPQLYVWNESGGATQNWQTPGNWTPARNVVSFDDVLSFSNGGTSTANNMITQGVGKIIMSGSTQVTLVPNLATAITLNGGNGIDLDIPAGCTMIVGGGANALTIGHLAAVGNSANIAGTFTLNGNSAANAYTATNSATTIDGTFNCSALLNTTTSTTNVNGVLNVFAGTVTSTSANLFMNAGSVYNHERNGNPVPSALWNLTSTCNIKGVTNTVPTSLSQAFGNFTWNCAGQSGVIHLGATLTTVNGDLTFNGTNGQQITLNTVTATHNLAIGGNLILNTGAGNVRTVFTSGICNINLAGNLVLNSGTFLHAIGTTNLNLSGNVSLNAGTISRTAGTSILNFIKATGTQTITQTAGVFSGIMTFAIGNGITTNTLQMLSNLDLGGALSPFTVNQNASLDCGTFVLSGSTAAFTLSNTAPGGTLITAHTDGIELTGAVGTIQTTGARTYSANANYIYDGVVSQNTGLGLTAANNLTIDNNANVTLTTNIAVSGTTTFTNGKLILNASNFTATNTAGTPFAGNAAGKYIVTNGSGQVFRSIATAGLPVNYTFPVGDISNYSPVQLNFTANSLARNIGVIVTAGPVPNNLPSLHYIDRSWTFTNSAAGTYTYDPTFTYAAGDETGTPANMKISRWVGPLWTEYGGTPNTIITPPQMSLTGSLNETTGPLSSYWTGRVYSPPVNYVWNGTTSNDWNTATNWTPNGIPGIIDNVTISVATPNPCLASGAFFSANNFTVNGLGNFQLDANSVLTVNGNYTATATVTYNCSSTLNIFSPASQNIPAANYGSLNISGGNRTLAPAGTIGICGQYTAGAGVITITGSTINYNSTAAQTISAANYNNLTISQNRGGSTITLEPGTIVVNGNFTPLLSNYVAFVDGNTFNFNGAAGQIIPAFFYFNLTSANATRIWANAGIIDIKGTFTPSSTLNGNTITGSTVRFSSNAAGINLSVYTTNVANRNFNNVIFDGVGGTWDAGSANLRPNGTLTVNNGTVNVATAVASILAVAGVTTVNGGTLNLATNTGAGTATFTGAVTVNGGTLNVTSGTGATTVTFSSTITVTGGTLNLSNGTGAATIAAINAINVNGGTFTVANTTAAVAGFTVTGNVTVNGGIFRLTNSTGAATMSIRGNLAVTTGTFTKSGGTGTFNFDFTSILQTRTFTQGPTATISGNTTFQCTGTTTACVLSIGSDLNLGASSVRIYNTGSGSGYTINLNQYVITSTGTFQLANGARFRTQHPDGISAAPAATGCVRTNVRSLGGSCLWWFEAPASAQRTGTGFPGSVDQITISNGTFGFTLDVTLRIQNSISNSGNIILGNNNLHIGYYNPVGPVAYTPGFTGSASKFVITNGTGMLVKYFNGTGGTYSYPIGDNTGTAEYSPVSLTISALSGGRDSIGFRVTDAQHPNDLSVTNYLSRYWSCGMISSATYNNTNTIFTYQTADVVGTESVLKIDRWSNPLTTWTQDAGSTVNTVANTLTTSSLNQTTGTLLNNDFASRSDAPFYYQTASSGTWSNPAIWQISTDPAFISPAPVAAGVAPNAVNSLGVTIRNTHNVQVAGPENADQMIIAAGGTLTVNSGETFTIANGIGTDLSVNGSVNNSGTMVTTGNLEFNNASIYSHSQDGGTIPTALWNTGSMCEIIGIVNTPPAGLNQTFYNFEWNSGGQNTSIQLSGLLTNISNNFSLLSTGIPANDLRIFDNTTSGTLNIGSNLDISGGTLAIMNSASNGAGIATINVNGNLLISSGGIDMTGSNANTGASSNLNIKGDVTITASGTIYRTQNVPSVVTLNKSTGNQLFSVVSNSINSDNITWRIGDGATTNSVDLNSAIDIHAAATFRVMASATLNCGVYTLTGGNFDTQNASTLGIGSAAGISNAPAASGNIQTTNRTYLNSANYTYNGTLNQVTGNGLPGTLTGNLTIDNSGISGNNTVTLTSTGSTGSTLILNAGLFAIGTGQQYNISNTGSVVAVAGDFATGSTGGTLNFNGAGTFTGNSNPFNVFISGALNFGAGTVTIQNAGMLRINAGGSVASNGPFYANNSTLQYNINGNFNRGLEWSAASGRGFPYHAQITNNTTLNAAGAGAINAAVAFNLAGNLIVDAGSALSMNFGGNNMTVPLNIAGNIDFTGTITASGAAGGNIALGGNWINNGSALISFNPNNRSVTFNGSSLQSITGTNTTINPFDGLIINNAAGVTLSSQNVIVQQALTLTNGKLDLNNNQLTLGTSGNNGTLTGGSASSYIISGSATAKLVRFTTTNATTYAFPLGDASNYSPISVQFFSSPMAANTQLNVNVIAAAHPSLGTSTNYISRYWRVEPANLPNAETDYAVSYQYADADIVGVEADLKPFKHSVVGWIAAQGSGAQFEMGTGNVTPALNTINWSGLNNFSDFTGNGNGTPLPISLLSFNAQVVLGNVELSWTTATETNNDYFTVERSKDGVDFKQLAQVPGAGNSNSLLNYNLLDQQALEGVSYYRLKQTDFDGKYSYSEIRTVSINTQQAENISIYPNPSNLNGVYVSFSTTATNSPVKVQLVDLFGKVVFSASYSLRENQSTVFVNFNQVAIGIYTLQTINSYGEIESHRISIVN